MSRRIICVGEVMTDVVALLHEDINYGSDTDVKISYRGGGAAANVASWLGIKGANVTLVARVGNDANGERAISELVEYNVNCRVTKDSRAATGTVIVLVTPDGERTMLPDSGANGFLQTSDLPELLSGDLLYLSGYLLLNPASRDAAREILRIARDAGVKIFVDPASSAPILKVGADHFLNWLGKIDVLLANLDEAMALTGETEPWRAAEALLTSAQIVVIKLGADGAIGLSHEYRSRVSAVPVANVIDTTGAGDSFAAGFLLASDTLDEALASGSAVAAQCVVDVGARPQVAKR